MKVLDDFTPLVERISIDEAFADVVGCTHLFGSPAEIAQKIRQRVKSELGLPISVGVARTKHLAKIASQVAKPDGLVVVDPEKRAGVPARPAGRVDVGRGPGHARAAGRAWRDDHRPAGRTPRRTRSIACSVRRRARSSWRWPGTAIRARSARTIARSRPARSRRSAASPPSSASTGRRWLISPTASARGCAPSRWPAAP